MVFGIILSVVITHNFKINVRDKIKLKILTPHIYQKTMRN